ncbi:MAG: LysM peptidoglycan-binding domain-containing protein, partial [Polyangiales bacterium]
MNGSRWTRRSLTTLMFAAACSSVALRARADTYPYTVQKGDTCDGIAAKLLGDKSRYEEMHDVNPELGPPPHHLKPGTILRIPKPGADAHLTHIHKDVDAETPKPHKGVKDEPLLRGHRVSTQVESAAEVTFLDQTRLQLGEQTLIVILGASSSKVSGRKFLTDTTLVKGTLRAHLSAIAGETGPAKDRHVPLAIEGGAKVTLGTGESKVSVDDAKTTRLAVYKGEGKLAAAGAEVKVPSGFGSKA